jgi:hypothetical protein
MIPICASVFMIMLASHPMTPPMMSVMIQFIVASCEGNRLPTSAVFP